MTQLAQILAANAEFVADPNVSDSRPSRRLAVLTCMDTRIDVLAALGLKIGEAHVMRNGGGRVTEDVLRSLALSSHELGVDTFVIMHHTKCGLTTGTDAQLKERTGADLDFLAIDDHTKALQDDVDIIADTPYLSPVLAVAGVLYDVETGGISEVASWERLS